MGSTLILSLSLFRKPHNLFYIDPTSSSIGCVGLKKSYTTNIEIRRFRLFQFSVMFIIVLYQCLKIPIKRTFYLIK